MKSIPALEHRTNLPFAVDDNNEIYLPLSLSPEFQGEGYRLTGWKEDDVDDVIDLFNDPFIGRWSVRRPFPYRREHASYLVDALPRIETYLQILNDISSSSSSSSSTQQASAEQYSDLMQYHQGEPGPFPIGALRNNHGKVIGDMVIFISTRGKDLPPTNTNTNSSTASPNTSRDEKGEEGEEQAWEVAYNLLPAYARKGLGSAMMCAALEYVRWLGVKRVVGFCESTNQASAALLLKTGFGKVLEHEVIFPPSKCGDKRIEWGFEQYL